MHNKIAFFLVNGRYKTIAGKKNTSFKADVFTLPADDEVSRSGNNAILKEVRNIGYLCDYSDVYYLGEAVQQQERYHIYYVDITNAKVNHDLLEDSDIFWQNVRDMLTMNDNILMLAAYAKFTKDIKW